MQEIKTNPTLKDFQEYIKACCVERGLSNNERGNVFAHLLEEAGELAGAARKFERGRGNKEDIELEAADVLIFLIHACNLFGINLEEAFRKKEVINNTRNWKLGE